MKSFLTLVILFFSVQFQVSAQKRIAIINESDSVIHYKYAGITVFENMEDTVICNFNLGEYTQESLYNRLSKKNIVTLLGLSEYSQFENNKAAMKAWLKSLAGTYDLVIIIKSGQTTAAELGAERVLLNGSGLYRQLIHNHVYSTIYFDVYQTENGKRIPTNLMETDDFLKVDSQKDLTSNCEYIYEKLKVLMEEHIDVFMTTRYFFMRYSMPFEI